MYVVQENGKWTQLFTETVLAFNLHFEQLGLNLEENQVHHSKERNYRSRKNVKFLQLLCISTRFLSLKDEGIQSNWYRYLRKVVCGVTHLNT